MPSLMEDGEVDDVASMTEEPDGVSRRRFLQVMGASLALGAASGCTWEAETLLPLEKNIEERAAGATARYATAWDLGGAARGLVVSCYEGRPIKVEGNPAHPSSLGATDMLAQALTLALYDPDRSRAPAQRAGDVLADRSWDDAMAALSAIGAEARATKGAGLRILAEASSSETRARLRAALLEAMPQAVWHEWEPASRDAERAGASLAFGRPVRTHLRLDAARTIVGLDSDLLEGHPTALANARALMAARRPRDPGGKARAGDHSGAHTAHSLAPGADAMPRVYAVESRLTLLGACADHRLPLRSEQVGPFLAALLEEVRRLRETTGSPEAKAAPAAEGFLASVKVAAHLRAIARDLVASGPASLVCVGPSQPPAVHALAHRLHALLGSAGHTLYYTEAPDPARPSHEASLASLATALRAGDVRALVILGGNPAYDAPADLGFADALAQAGTTVHLSSHRDETSRLCSWHIPRAHPFESWGDARAWDGTASIAQPMIEPLFGARSAEEVLAALLGDVPREGAALVRASFDALHAQGGSKEESARRWRKALHDGVVEGTALPEARPSLLPAEPLPAWPSRALAAETPASGALELTYFPDPKVWDGRFANSAWLQEAPDPLTKLTWDNALLIAPATAKDLGVAHGALVRLEVSGRALEVAAYVMPGQAPGSLALALGYGRRAAGVVGGFYAEGVAPAGFDAGRLRASDALHIAHGAKVTPTGRAYPLSLTQGHHQIDETGVAGRADRLAGIVREGTLSEWREHPGFAAHRVHTPKPLKLWQDPAHAEGHRWGMAIDLGSCTGCNACVVACQSENNIAVVGKDQVARGREMHWMRIDRYFTGEPDEPRVALQPLLCQHCEAAPCEQVCPVAATVHSAEGLNDMVYNRCVGTRYCSNNCPYKVRRFNYFNFWKNLPGARNEPLTLLLNPDVTVRSRGVMEKCTFCVQRITAARIPAKNAGRALADGEVVTACAQVCPTEAIVFGDLADPSSAVSKRAASPRAYALLGELNIRPRISYLARITNPSEALAPAPASHGGAEGTHHG